MKGLKLVVSMLITSILMGSFVGCSGSSDAENPSTESSTTSEEKSNQIDTTEKVTIDFIFVSDAPQNDTDQVIDLVNEKLVEKINAELKIDWVEWADYMSKYSLLLASQDGTVDLVGTGDWLNMWDNVQKGAFLPLTEELLSTYAPKTWENVSDEAWEYCKYKDNIYVMPEDNFTQWTNYGFMYRMDWAKKAGLDTGVHSFEDMEIYLQWIKDNMPDVIPLDLDASVYANLCTGWISSKTQNILISSLPTQIFFGESADNPYELSDVIMEGDILIEFAKTMKRWNDKGFWREDVLNYTGDPLKQLEAGLNGADLKHTEWWGGEISNMEQYQPGSDLDFFWFGEETGNLVSLSVTNGACAVASKSDQPERALMLYDLLRNDKEIYQLFNYGVEGEHYELDQNGQLVYPEGFDATTEGVSTFFWYGRNDDLGLRDATKDWTKIDKKYEEYEKVAKLYPYGTTVLDTSAISTELNNLSSVYASYMTQIAYGKAEDPEAYVKEFREALKAAGYEKCVSEIESQFSKK